MSLGTSAQSEIVGTLRSGCSTPRAPAVAAPALQLYNTRVRAGAMMTRAVALLLLFAASSACIADAVRDTFDMSRWAIDNKLFGAPHARAEYELPDGVRRNTPAADRYWTKWLQCSTLVVWCTPEEVACGCTYEPTGTWYRGRYAWCAHTCRRGCSASCMCRNQLRGADKLASRALARRNSGKDEKIWPYCQPGLRALYANSSACDQATKDASSCLVPKELRVWNGNGECVNHELCGDGYCHDKVRATRAPLV